MFVFGTLSGVADLVSRVVLVLLGACTCCSSTVGAVLLVAFVLGVVLGAGARVDVDACCPAATADTVYFLV